MTYPQSLFLYHLSTVCKPAFPAVIHITTKDPTPFALLSLCTHTFAASLEPRWTRCGIFPHLYRAREGDRTSPSFSAIFEPPRFL